MVGNEHGGYSRAEASFASSCQVNVVADRGCRFIPESVLLYHRPAGGERGQ